MSISINDIKVSEEGRRITYAVTPRGVQICENELRRMRSCLNDAETELIPETEPSGSALPVMTWGSGIRAGKTEKLS